MVEKKKICGWIKVSQLLPSWMIEAPREIFDWLMEIRFCLLPAGSEIIKIFLNGLRSFQQKLTQYCIKCFFLRSNNNCSKHSNKNDDLFSWTFLYPIFFILKNIFFANLDSLVLWDHSSITSSKRWVGGVRKLQFLMIYSTVNHQRVGWVGLKKPKTWWRNTWMVPN